MSLNDIAGGKYVSLTTHRRDGTTSATPVWIADLGDGTVGFTTGLDSLKVKRIRNDPRVSLQACDMRGRVKDGAESVDGTATVVDGPEFERVRAVVRTKYGLQYRLMIGLDKVASIFKKGDQAASCAIVIAAAE